MKKSKQDEGEKKVNVETLLKEKKEDENALRYLESEYRKANISDKNYNEQKEKFTKKIEELTKKLDGLGRKQTSEKEEEMEESSEDEIENDEDEKTKKSARNAEENKEEKPKIGFLKRIFQKKREDGRTRRN